MSKCYRSGLCCKTGVCPFGTWNDMKGQCEYLLEIQRYKNGGTVYECTIASTIVRDPSSWISPAFGAGCCMPLFNENRRLIMMVEKGRF